MMSLLNHSQGKKLYTYNDTLKWKIYLAMNWIIMNFHFIVNNEKNSIITIVTHIHTWYPWENWLVEICVSSGIRDCSQVLEFRGATTGELDIGIYNICHHQLSTNWNAKSNSTQMVFENLSLFANKSSYLIMWLVHFHVFQSSSPNHPLLVEEIGVWKKYTQSYVQ